MLVIDSTTIKLLNMKERLLEVTNDRDAILDEYGRLVQNIDYEFYNSLVNKIKDTDYYNLPLEEQLKFLMNVEEEYNEYNEFQCRYRRVFERYNSKKLKLSQIHSILITTIKHRISAISGYLLNVKNINDNNNKLEKLNLDLIDNEKRSDAIKERFIGLEEELRNNLLDTEGRMYDNNGTMVYISIVSEYANNGYDLRELLDNKLLLDNELKKANDLKISEEEKMMASNICYNSMPNINTRELYRNSVKDVISAKYKLLLLELVDLFNKNNDNYNDLKKKRDKIKELITTRIKYLNDLNMRMVIDPFTRIKLDEQYEIIDKLGDNSGAVTKIRDQIQDLVEQNERMIDDNRELLELIEDRPNLFNANPMKVEKVKEPEKNIYIPKHNNKVISIKDVNDNINFNRISEKTKSVIHRVYEIMNKKSTPEPVLNEEIKEAPPKVEIGQDKVINSDLFQDSKPFLDTQLFTDKYDDAFEDLGLFADKSNETFAVPSTKEEEKVVPATNVGADKMPEIFWDMPEVVKEPESDNKLSFDEQIDALIGSNDSAKTKKLAT